MSERTTIGGTVYESVGSTSSTLLLKCNGTARIQWGSKLIDLIKNGKIASSSDQEQIFIVSDESEMESDGVYVVNTEDATQLWICKDRAKYNLTGADLYISANKKQDITVEQKHQALQNIGMYYNTLEDVEKSKIQNGLVYVMDTKNLYTIKNGIVEEFEAKVKTVTVEKEEETGEIINSSVQIVLSVLDEEYLILADQRITANYSIHVKNHAQIGSEGATASKGYRLYIDGDISYLDVDKIRVRRGLSIPDYIEVTHSDLKYMVENGVMEPHQWYLITDFQNHWKLPANSIQFNRPILVRALTGSSFYKEGQLFKDRRVSIQYDYSYNEPVKVLVNSTEQAPQEPEEQIETVEEEVQNPVTEIKARGRIIWMKDNNGNEANFDFLDYTDYKGQPLTTLHASDEDVTLDASVFPRTSYNNKFTVNNPKGTILKNGLIDDTDASILNFQFDDTANLEDLKEQNTLPRMNMHDNNVVCNNFTLTGNCSQFSNNTIISANNVSFGNVATNSSFGNLYNCQFLCTLENCKFNDVTNGYFYGDLQTLTVNSNIILAEPFEFNESNSPIIYQRGVVKEVIFSNNQFQLISGLEQTFFRGMIIMYSGVSPVPAGWAICDGSTHTYNNITTTTPNLVNRFIKAVATADEIGEVNNPDLNTSNELTLQSKHLPGNIYYGGDADGQEDHDQDTSFLLTGDNNDFKKFSNTPIKIEPNYYSLIFIMKL